jgi:threonine dehydrogenase-like Zn-dependent dehydrogenase
MQDLVEAATLVGPEQLALRRFPRPVIGDDDGLLRVEGCGICGADVEQLHASKDRKRTYPIIPGHEVVGRIEEIGPSAARRWDLNVGDRVAVEPPLPCRRCRECQDAAKHSTCTDPSLGDLRAYSQIPVEIAPGLWGGYGELLYLHPLATLHRMPDEVPIETAVLFNPMANGIEWAVLSPNLRLGDAVLILGPGQRGLTSVVAARHAGAGRVIVTGLAHDAHKLELARELGADEAVVVDGGDDVGRVLEATGGVGLDVVVDTTPGATGPILDALDVVRPGGTVVLAGLKNMRIIDGLATDRIVLKEITLKGVRSASTRAFSQAVDVIASGRYPLGKMHTRSYPRDQAEKAVRTLAGQTQDPVISVCLRH